MGKKLTTAVAATLVGALGLTACGSSDAAGGKETTIDLVAYSTPQTAFGSIEKAFQKTDAGKDVKFSESYGPSGDQSRAVEGGQPADFVNFSLESDVTRLVDAKLVDSDWKTATGHDGIVADSVVVLVVRKGNPKKITGWDDLVKPGIGIVTPNPASSGGARWNTLAAYGHVLANGGTEADAKKYLTDYFKHAVSLPGSARDALTSFTSGNGDVLVSYENEAILAKQKGEDIDYIVPDQTLLIETPAAVTKDAPKAAADFRDFLFTPEAQKDFRESGYRTVIDGITGDVEGANDPANPFPTPKKLLTVAKDFGGWDAAKKKFFDEENGIVTKIQIATGTSE
ncbi:sulfate ABC transporter substrate-binding protein [Nocardioides jejuensis]|uniref:Sulfate ABC transporter substrate-binding protein n=1 Tax=Nocardioides jejuensis TaxID=2502782 RepID=A0A4R1BVH8_9ACTN|nr:sulfate ABC transporter substrate-binding protein [Nocardioides jejuensis]TCJ21738.1 sulfate ABC transporter substrate-binding protein [Nocardioides jejuensis]